VTHEADLYQLQAVYSSGIEIAVWFSARTTESSTASKWVSRVCSNPDKSGDQAIEQGDKDSASAQTPSYSHFTNGDGQCSKPGARSLAQ